MSYYSFVSIAKVKRNFVCPEQHLIGMGAKDAVYLLESMGLKARITGIGKVKSQSIPAGNTLRKGQTIQLRLN